MFFTELNEFGWNWLTASSAVLIAITVWQYRANTRQAIKIWTTRSAESVSITAAASVFFIVVASLYYGLTTRSLVISFTGGLCIPTFFLVWGAWRYGEPNRQDRIVVACGVAGMLAYLLPVAPAWVFSAFAIATTIPLCDQLRKLYETGKRGVVKGELLATYVTKNVFLTIFAFAASEPVYTLFTPIWLVLSIWLLAKWVVCEPGKPLITA